MKKFLCFVLIFVIMFSALLTAKSVSVFAEEDAAVTAAADTDEDEDSSSFSKALVKRILISSLIILPIAIFLGIRSGNKKYGKN